MFKYQRILVPLDGSELAEQALVPAITIAKAMNATIVLFRAVPSLLSTIGRDKELEQSAIEQSSGTATDYLRSMLSLVIDAGLDGYTRVTPWQPAAKSIIAYAQEIDTDLIVMSSYGRSGLSRWRFGSVAEKVLRHAPCHLLIIRARVDGGPFERQRILVPLDGSQMAEEALKPAVSLAAAAEADLLLLRVVVSGKAALAAADRQVLYEDIETRERGEAETYLQRVQGSLEESHHHIKNVVVAGSVAETIVNIANERQTGIIVMSSHGRSGVSRWVFGSIAEQVLRATSCATLIIRNGRTARVQESCSKSVAVQPNTAKIRKPV